MPIQFENPYDDYDPTLRSYFDIWQPMAGVAPQKAGRALKVGAIQVNLSVDPSGIDRATKNLQALPQIMFMRAAGAIGAACIHLLAQAQPRVPYWPGGKVAGRKGYQKPSTGKLRKSGSAVLFADLSNPIKIAGGTTQGTIFTTVRGITPDFIKGGTVRNLVGYVYYHRIGDEGDDIALWTHESLLPHDDRGQPQEPGSQWFKYARMPGTGPKYLELPFMQFKDMYMRNIVRAILDVPNQLTKLLHTVKKAKGPFEIDQTEVVKSKIARMGYFESALL